MTTVTPEAPTLPDVDLSVLTDCAIPCQITLYWHPTIADRAGVADGCPEPAAWRYLPGCGCQYTLCDQHAAAGRGSQKIRASLCPFVGCPTCRHCGEGQCAGSERIEPL